MKRKLNHLGQKILSKLLVLLGFSCTFLFMACYGPRPGHYDPTLEDELADSFLADSALVDSAAQGEKPVTSYTSQE